MNNRSSQSFAALLVLGAGIAAESGAAVAVLIFPELGPMGVVSLRIGFSAVLLLVIARPRLRGRSRADWMTVVGFGLVLAVMNVSFYLAIERIPLGVAATIEVLGPLVLSVVMGRRALSWVWAILAFAGVAILCGVDVGRLDPVGIALAVLAGVCWAGYILGSARTGRRFERLEGLALAMAVSAIVILPFGIVLAGPALLRLDLLGLGLLVAVLSSAIPYGVEFVALRRLPESTFGVLMSLAPATAVAAGFVLLHQALTPLDLVAIGLVTAASIGAVLTGPEKAPVAEPIP
ncbi:EamA family transporter [Compostimonas suwonensis]|uniref:Inner membrane transporter RhtA n=1 Tax=Compostimonas suwonensis TaxID=1048394 RepID=A0A2M9BYY3_9MICO|nr:EamA family transporter [Compostimonas suwonensis]PJJ63276.1 inner membrane transporter RhtA [Compostimonas suwonensis]